MPLCTFLLCQQVFKPQVQVQVPEAQVQVQVLQNYSSCTRVQVPSTTSLLDTDSNEVTIQLYMKGALKVEGTFKCKSCVNGVVNREAKKGLSVGI